MYLQRGVTLYHLQTIEFVTHALKQLKQHDVAVGVTPLMYKMVKGISLYSLSVSLRPLIPKGRRLILQLVQAYFRCCITMIDM